MCNSVRESTGGYPSSGRVSSKGYEAAHDCQDGHISSVHSNCQWNAAVPKQLAKVPLLDCKIERWINDMLEDIEDMVLEKIRSSEKFSEQVDESAGASRHAQLLANVWFVDGGDIRGKFFFFKAVPNKRTGEEIYHVSVLNGGGWVGRTVSVSALTGPLPWRVVLRSPSVFDSVRGNGSWTSYLDAARGHLLALLLHMPNWLQMRVKVAYLADISRHLNELNAKVQGKEENLVKITWSDKLRGFRSKLAVWRSLVEQGRLEMFSLVHLSFKQEQTSWPYRSASENPQGEI